MCMLRWWCSLNIPRMFYCSKHMAVRWDSLNISNDGCSAYMSIIMINSKFCGVKWDSVLYMVKVILTHITVECGVVDPYVYRFFDGSS